MCRSETPSLICPQLWSIKPRSGSPGMLGWTPEWVCCQDPGRFHYHGQQGGSGFQLQSLISSSAPSHSCPVIRRRETGEEHQHLTLTSPPFMWSRFPRRLCRSIIKRVKLLRNSDIRPISVQDSELWGGFCSLSAARLILYANRSAWLGALRRLHWGNPKFQP